MIEAFLFSPQLQWNRRNRNEPLDFDGFFENRHADAVETVQKIIRMTINANMVPSMCFFSFLVTAP